RQEVLGAAASGVRTLTDSGRKPAVALTDSGRKPAVALTDPGRKPGVERDHGRRLRVLQDRRRRNPGDGGEAWRRDARVPRPEPPGTDARARDPDRSPRVAQ